MNTRQVRKLTHQRRKEIHSDVPLILEEGVECVVQDGGDSQLRAWCILGMIILTPCLLAISGDSMRGINSPSVQVGGGEKQEVSPTPIPVLVKNMVAQAVISQPKEVAPPRLSIPSDAVVLAIEDAIEVQQKDPFGLPFTRWIWIQSGDPDDAKVISDVLAKISRADITVRPVVKGIIARVDLRRYASSEQDVADWISLWEQLQFDPWFSLLVTQDTIRLLSPEYKESNTVRVKKMKWSKDKDNKDIQIPTFVDEKLSVLDINKTPVVRLNADHLRRSGIEKLQLACGTVAPIVDARYFVGRVLTTIKDRDGEKENLFSTVWGGLYYEFSGIRPATTKGIKTDLEQLLFDLNVARKDESYEQVLSRVKGQQRAGMLFSSVTAKRRRLVWFSQLNVRLTEAVPTVFITEDVRDQDLDSSTDPIMNLVKFRPAAFEVIFNKPNGQQGYALFDGNGKLLDEAAQNVVADRGVPDPYTPKLQPGISCIRCHGKDDGWKPFSNDVQTLLKKRKLDFFGDTTEKNKAIFTTVMQVASQYEGDTTIFFQRLRNDYAKATDIATGIWKNGDKISTVKLTSEQTAKLFAQDRYDRIDARLAIKYMGFPPAPIGKELELLNHLLPPVKLNVGGIIPEDIRIGALKDGLKINPPDLALTYQFMLTRALQVQSQEKGKEKGNK